MFIVNIMLTITKDYYTPPVYLFVHLSVKSNLNLGYNF